MNTLVLHHFDSSPFAEKVRLALGFKGCSWYSVDIPMVMPKPDLTALTGGYRKTPVLQVGADIYCDTQCIVRELERRFPAPTLFPEGSEALCLALSQWSDVALFRPGAGLSLATNQDLPESILRDRREFFSFLDFESLDQNISHLFAQFNAQLALLNDMLADGRPYLLGENPSWADVLGYFPLWMARANIEGASAFIEGFADLCRWEQSVRGWGHGEQSPVDSAAALVLAASSTSVSVAGVENGPREDFSAGESVTVAPDDYGSVAVFGELLQLDHQHIAIVRQDPRAGELVVHFPRIGYRLCRV